MAKTENEGKIVVDMVIRNRLVSVLLRIVIFGFLLSSLTVHVANYDNPALAFSTFTVQVGTIGIIVLGLEIIFNLIDLRHGVLGVPAGLYMPIALPITVFCFLGGILYFATLLPSHAAPGGMYDILFHSVLLLGPLLDWIFLDEKGTVRYANAMLSQLYPILFFVFGYFRTIIWNDSPIYNGYMYALPFLDFTGPNIVLNAFLFFLMTLGSALAFVVVNNLLAGKYGFLRPSND